MPKSKKIVIFLSEAPYALYEKHLKESMLTASGFIISLLVEKEKGNVERRPIGRPTKKLETQAEKEARWIIEKAEPKTIPHPDQDKFRGELLNRYWLEIWSVEVDMYGPAEHKELQGYIPKEQRTD